MYFSQNYLFLPGIILSRLSKTSPATFIDLQISLTAESLGCILQAAQKRHG